MKMKANCLNCQKQYTADLNKPFSYCSEECQKKFKDRLKGLIKKPSIPTEAE